MKRILYFLVVFMISLTASALTTPIVNLTGGGSVAAGTSLSMSLNGLMPSAAYSVACYLNTSFPFQYLLLGSNFGDTTSTILSYSINGHDVAQDELLVGQNLVVVNGKFTNPGTGFIVFTNLDQSNPFTVTKCFGIPIQAL